MPYTAEHPANVPSPEELRARIPGWGIDREHQHLLHPTKHPIDPAANGAHWEMPEQQPELEPRERSIEHRHLTPVFGTSTPPRGLSALIRRQAYALGEGKATHWLLLVVADRVNSAESAIASTFRGDPVNPWTETGITAEFTRHGVSSRVGRGRADLKHTWIDPLIVGAPWLLAGGIGFAAARAVKRRAEQSQTDESAEVRVVGAADGIVVTASDERETIDLGDR